MTSMEAIVPAAQMRQLGLNRGPDLGPDLGQRADGLLVSLVVPVFNEEDSIPLFVERVTPILAQVRAELGDGARTEIVFVDDGSYDWTAKVITSLPAGNSLIRLVKLSRNFGKDAALAAGLAHVQGDAVIPMDVDLQDPPELLVDMVKAWQSGYRVVNAVRQDRSSDGWVKRQSARGFYALVNRLSTYPMPKNVGDFRLMDARVVQHLNAMEERIRFNKGLVAWLGYASTDIYYTRPKRAAGTTKWKAWSLWNFALDGITGSSTLPLRIWSYAGGLLALIAIIYATFIVGRTLVLGVDQPGYASIMAVVLVLGSANMLALGILGEYVGRISIEVRRRPLFLVDTVQDLPAQSSQDIAPSKTTRQHVWG